MDINLDILLPGESGAQWANGCPACRFGIVRQGKLTGALSLFEERVVQGIHGEVEFCTCRAGHMARQYARKGYSAMTEDGRRLAVEKVDAALTEIATKEAQDAPPMRFVEVGA